MSLSKLVTAVTRGRGQFRVRLSESRLRIEGDNKFYERDGDSGFKILFHVGEGWQWRQRRFGVSFFAV